MVPQLAPMNGMDLFMFRVYEVLQPRIQAPKYVGYINAIVLLDGDRGFSDSDADRQKLIARLSQKLVQKYHRLCAVANHDGSWTRLKPEDLDWNYHLTTECDPGITTCPQDTELSSEMQARIAELDTETLDETKPLWRLHVLSIGDETVLLLRISHAIGDGLRLGSCLVEVFTDEEGKDVDVATEKGRTLKQNNSSAKGPGLPKQNNKTCGFLGSVASWIWRAACVPVYYAWLSFDVCLSFLKLLYASKRPRCTVCAFSHTKGPADLVAPAPSWTRKTVFFPALPFEVVKSIKNALNATVNDVVYSCFSAAVDRYCLANDGALSSKLSLRTQMAFGLPLPKKTPDSRTREVGDCLANKMLLLSVDLVIDTPETRSQILREVRNGNEPGIESQTTAPSALRQQSALRRLILTRRNMDALKNSTQASVGGFFSEIVNKYESDARLGQHVMEIAETHALVFSNIPGYVAYRNKTAGRMDSSVFPSARTSADHADQPYKSLKLLGRVVKGIFAYIPYTLLQVPGLFVHTYQDKVFTVLTVDPQSVKQPETIIPHFHDEIYALAACALEKLSQSSNSDCLDGQRLRRFLEERPIVGTADTVRLCAIAAE